MLTSIFGFQQQNDHLLTFILIIVLSGDWCVLQVIGGIGHCCTKALLDIVGRSLFKCHTHTRLSSAVFVRVLLSASQCEHYNLLVKLPLIGRRSAHDLKHHLLSQQSHRMSYSSCSECVCVCVCECVCVCVCVCVSVCVSVCMCVCVAI